MAQRVLVSIDDSLPATAALQHAVSQFSDAELTVLHVCGVEKADGSVRQRVLSEEYERERGAAERLAEGMFEKARTTVEAAGVTFTTALEYGPASREICEYAAGNGIDHIVIGTHGRTGLSRLLLGSIAEGVVRRSSVPVTVVPEPP